MKGLIFILFIIILLYLISSLETFNNKKIFKLFLKKMELQDVEARTD